MTVVRVLILAGAVLLSGCVLALTLLPASLLLGAWVPAGATVLAGSSVTRGSAIFSAAGVGSDMVEWHWCPRHGLRTFCIRSSGPTGHLALQLTPGFGAVAVDEVEMRGVDPALFGFQSPLWAARINGAIDTLHFRPIDDCWVPVLDGPPSTLALSDVRIWGRRVADHQLFLAPATSDLGVAELSGPVATGEWRLAPTRTVVGRLRVTPDPVLARHLSPLVRQQDGQFVLESREPFPCR